MVLKVDKNGNIISKKDGEKKSESNKSQPDKPMAEPVKEEKRSEPKTVDQTKERELVVYFTSGHPLALKLTDEEVITYQGKLDLAMRCCGLATLGNAKANGRNIAFYTIN